MRGNRKGVLKDLDKGIVWCVFVKKNGIHREMWATRHNGVIQRNGHDRVDFYQAELSALEKRFQNYVHVYDIQEDDVRIININTLVEGKWDFYEADADVKIPKIEKREVKKKKGVIKKKAEMQAEIDERNRLRKEEVKPGYKEEKWIEKELEDVGDVEDIF